MKKLYESIIDSDAKVLKDAEHLTLVERIKKVMSVATNDKCKYDEGYIIDEQGAIHVIGYCPKITIGSMFDGIKIADMEPSSVCELTVVDVKVASQSLPIQLGKLGFRGFTLIYDTREDINSGDLPMFVHGNIKFKSGKNLNLPIMPSCTENLYIFEKGFNKVTYPVGFPDSVKTISISRK